MGIEIFEERESNFRIIIQDLKTKKTKTITLLTDKSYNIEKIKKEIKACLIKNRRI